MIAPVFSKVILDCAAMFYFLDPLYCMQMVFDLLSNERFCINFQLVYS